LTLLPELFQPFALYKTLAEGALLVITFQYFPMGIFGFLASRLSRLGRRRAPLRPLDLRLSKDKIQ